jgi:hypothetical protein
MPVNLALGHVSNDFLIAALVLYSLSVVAFAGDFAFGRPRRQADSAVRVQQAREPAAALATVGAASATPGEEGAKDAGGAAGGSAAPDSMPTPAVPARTPPPWSPGDWRSTGRPGATCTSSSRR